jgi:hypothetical protein
VLSRRRVLELLRTSWVRLSGRERALLVNAPWKDLPGTIPRRMSGIPRRPGDVLSICARPFDRAHVAIWQRCRGVKVMPGPHICRRAGMGIDTARLYSIPRVPLS